MKISIVIPTYNSIKQIDKILLSLKSLETDSRVSHEIIIVDNNSTDATYEYLEKIKNSVGFVLLSETKPGSAYALIRGISVSTGDLIITCADDNFLDKRYLIKSHYLFTKYPSLGLVGPGIINAVDENLNQLETKYSQFFQEKNIAGEFNEGGPKYEWKNMPPGSATVCQRKVLLEWIKKFKNNEISAIGRSGKNLGAGEDAQIIYTALKLNYSIGVSDLLKIKHITVKRKLKRYYIKKMYFGVYSCHQQHVEAWPQLRDQYLNIHLKSTFEIIYNHFIKYKHKSLLIGKYKHLISALAERYGILSIRGQNDFFLYIIIKLLRLN
jgi:glycosyltransferase involved in cell wall biosynthesis